MIYAILSQIEPDMNSGLPGPEWAGQAGKVKYPQNMRHIILDERKAMKIKSPIALALVAVAAGFVLSGLFASCSPAAKDKPFLETAFEEGRGVFFRTIAEAVESHPDRGRLTAGELAKARDLRTAYPRLYGIMMNYYFAKDEPVFRALIKEGGPESMRRFRAMYLDLAADTGRMFVRCLFSPSVYGAYFQKILPRFKGKDAIDVVVMSTGYLAKLDIPLPPPAAPRALDPEFEKQWGLDAATFRAAHGMTRGRGVRVAVLDSGIDTTHPVFGRTSFGSHFNFVGRDGFPWALEGPPMVDYGWHGTLVSTIVARYAPEAQITLYRFQDSDTMNDSPYPLIATNNMGAALYKAVHDGNDVVNLSAGSNVSGEFLEEACRYAYENNVVFVVAGPYYHGRFMGENNDYPAHYPVNLAVTGIAKLGENRYGYWDIAAPDATTAVGSPCDPFVGFPYYSGEKDRYAAGISCATPIVTSLVALVEAAYPRLGTEAPGEYVEAVRKLVTGNANARILGYEGYSPDCGYGLIDAEKTVKAALALRAERGSRSAGTAEAAPSAPPAAAEDGTFAGGRQIFHKEMEVALGLHPEKYRLLHPEIERIEKGADGLPGLYEKVINVMFWKDGPRLLGLRGTNPEAFTKEFHALCREAADRFVESLFAESPGAGQQPPSSAGLGLGRLDLALDALDRKADSREAGDPSKRAAALASGTALELCRFPAAVKTTSGEGLKLAVIDSGCDFDSGIVKKARFDHSSDYCLVGRRQAPWEAEALAPADDRGRGTLLAAIVAACAPGTEIRTYKINAEAGSRYEYWPAMELAQAIYKAANDGSDIIVTGAAFSRDFPFLKQACQWAYFRNVIIVAPNGTARPGSPAPGAVYPSGYDMILAVAGAVPGPGGRLAPWPSSAASKYTVVAAPASFVPGGAPSNAYAAGVVGGLAALVSTRVPKTGKEFQGQQVQRVLEILKSSADPAAVGFRSFNPVVGYGLIDAEKAVGPAARAFVKKMTETDERFAKRMAELEEESRKAGDKGAETKKD